MADTCLQVHVYVQVWRYALKLSWIAHVVGSLQILKDAQASVQPENSQCSLQSSAHSMLAVELLCHIHAYSELSLKGFLKIQGNEGHSPCRSLCRPRF